jgi:hypothetical protein
MNHGQVPFARTPRTSYPSRPERHSEGEWTETIAMLRRLLILCTEAKEAETELHDAAHSSIAGGSVSLGRSASSTSATHELGISDMTGSVAVSPTHSYMRRQLALAAKELPELRRRGKHMAKHGEKVRGILMQAIPTALDADLRDRLDRIDETARGYQVRHRRPA